MKLRNKKTGEIIIPSDYTFASYDDGIRYGRHTYYSLAELNEEWEDYEEPKQWYGLNAIRDIGFEPLEYESFEDLYKHAKELGIAFDTREEGEKAVEKLKAFKRLKDKGFRFDGWDENHHNLGIVEFSFTNVKKSLYDFSDDLDLLFGGEE